MSRKSPRSCLVDATSRGARPRLPPRLRGLLHRAVDQQLDSRNAAGQASGHALRATQRGSALRHFRQARASVLLQRTAAQRRDVRRQPRTGAALVSCTGACNGTLKPAGRFPSLGPVNAIYAPAPGVWAEAMRGAGRAVVCGTASGLQRGSAPPRPPARRVAPGGASAALSVRGKADGLASHLRLASLPVWGQRGGINSVDRP